MSESYDTYPENGFQRFSCENYEVFRKLEHPADARFVFPTDESVIEKFQYINERLGDWKQTDPGVIGATVFGSTTKGYANPDTSDVDVTVFVDTDRIGLQLDPEVASASVCWDDWYAYRNKAQLPMQYVNEAERIFANPNDLEDKLPINVQVFPISHEYLKLSAGFEARSALRLARYRQLLAEGNGTEADSIADWSSQATDAESLQALPALMKVLDCEPGLSKQRDILTVRHYLDTVASREDSEIARLRSAVFGSDRLLSNLPVRLFNLSLSPELQIYRQTFLNEIAVTSQPDIVWSYFVKRLTAFEDSEKHPRNIADLNYPRSINQALESYA